ncbi:MAG: hypothetical protein HGN29_16965 [Asgard group archaeon]|nr:hypothetical protein [Asgard group archaeon]
MFIYESSKNQRKCFLILLYLAVIAGWKLLTILAGVMATVTLAEWIIFGVEFALAVAAVILTASAILWIRIGGFLINLGLDIWGYIEDLND